MSYLVKVLVSIFLIYSCLFSSKAFADGQPVINEFLPHPSSGNKEWVEFYVPSGIVLNNYWIDDDTDFASDAGSSAKKQMNSLIPGSDSYHNFFILDASMLNNDGDTVALFAPDGTLLDHYTYTEDPGEDISIGRTPDGTGDFQVLIEATQGNANSSPKPPDTPTPAPTDKPTKEPKPTETPKPAKVPIPTSLTTKDPVTNQSVLADVTTNGTLSAKKIGSNDAYPTSIIGNYATPAKDTLVKVSPKRVLVKGISTSVPQFISIMVGGLLFICCGILLYVKKRKIWFFKI